MFEVISLPPDMHKNSIRHLAVCSEGQVAFGVQWQGDGPADGLVGTHNRGEQIALMDGPADQVPQMDGYVCSIAWLDNGGTVAVTLPRGGLLQLYDTKASCLMMGNSIADVCGVATINDGFVVTSGTGAIGMSGPDSAKGIVRSDLAWDNHLIRI